MGLSRVKTESRKYGRDTPSPASRPISVFFHKYENGWDKYRNTGGAGRDFFFPFSSLFLFLIRRWSCPPAPVLVCLAAQLELAQVGRRRLAVASSIHAHALDRSLARVGRQPEP